MLIFSFFGYKIYYLTIHNFFQNHQLIKSLEKLNFFWLTYQNYEEKSQNLKNKNDIKKISRKISKQITKKIWIRDVRKTFKKDYLLELCIYERIQKEIKLFHELACQLKNISKNNIYFVWVNTFKLNNFYFKKNLKIKNLCPSIFIYIHFLIKFIIKIFNFIIKKFLKFVEFKKKIKEHKKLFYKKYEYIFFPKGIVEGKFPKDFFFIKKNKKGIDNKNILVVELENKEIEGKHKSYLLRKKLDYCLWQNINFSSYKIKLVEIFKLYLKLFIHSKDIYISTLILKIFILNKKNLLNIKKISNLNYIIVGHEELIPLNIQVSALLSDIKIVSYQTRSKNSFPYNLFLFDYYFTTGKKLGDLAKKNSLLSKKSKYISIGNYKKKQFDFDKEKNIKIKKSIKKNYEYICSVWDYPSQINWYSNGREPIGNYKRNKILLEETLLLAKSFPGVFFLIKSKNLSWTKLEYFREIYLQIIKTKNIGVTDISYIQAINISDLAYGNYTSAMDQFIYFNKPIVVRNYYKTFYDEIYPTSMVSLNYNDSYKKILYILNNLSKSKKKLIKTKNFLFDKKTKEMSYELLKIIND